MCLFVTVAVAATEEELKQFFDSRRFHLSAAHNPAIKALLPSRLAAYYVLRGGCSCGLIDGPSAGDSPERMRERLRRKGWSTNKIDRAIAQSIGDGESVPREALEAFEFRQSLASLARHHEVWLIGTTGGGNPDDHVPESALVERALSASDVARQPLPEVNSSLLKISPDP